MCYWVSINVKLESLNLGHDVIVGINIITEIKENILIKGKSMCYTHLGLKFFSSFASNSYGSILFFCLIDIRLCSPRLLRTCWMASAKRARPSPTWWAVNTAKTPPTTTATSALKTRQQRRRTAWKTRQPPPTRPRC